MTSSPGCTTRPGSIGRDGTYTELCLSCVLCVQVLEICRFACEVNADSAQFPADWLFHYRWGKGKECRMPDGNTITFETVGGRTSAIVSKVQLKTRQGAVVKTEAEGKKPKPTPKPKAKPKKKAAEVKVDSEAEDSEEAEMAVAIATSLKEQEALQGAANKMPQKKKRAAKAAAGAPIKRKRGRG